MQRKTIQPREDYQSIVEKQGLSYHTVDDKAYWHETAYYEFNSKQIATIEKATEELHQLYIKATDWIVSEQPELLEKVFGIPKNFVQPVIDSWSNESDDIYKVKCLNYGRFDLGYNGVSAPKLFEYNCDTPTSLIEASIIQWYWKEDNFKIADQYNSIHERLVERYASLKANHYIDEYIGKIHFTGTNDAIGEDACTIAYHMDICEQAGIKAEIINAADIGWTPLGWFVDNDNKRIDTLFHLYPWEWFMHEEFGKYIPQGNTKFIEPMWKSIWSNKAMLPILWQLFAGHDNILPASFEPMAYDHVAKPILSREGANVSIMHNGEVVEATGGIYNGEPMVYQKMYNLPEFDGYHPIIGAWCVNGFAAGMGIREDKSLITANNSIFTPHIIKG